MRFALLPFPRAATVNTLCGILTLWLSASCGIARVDAAPPGFAAGGPGATPANEVTNFKGKLKGMRRGVVMVEKEDGSEAMVMLPETVSSFQFVAKASPAFLRRGMLVRFSGDFGPGGIPVSPINKVTLFQPVPLQSLHGRAKEQFTPGVHSDQRGRGKQMMAGKLTVVGSLLGLTPNGVLAVQAGKTPVQIPLSADAELQIQYNNLSLAQPGDTVSVAGFYQPPNENQVKADRITITTDRVYGEAPAEEGQRRRRRGEGDAAPADGAPGEAADAAEVPGDGNAGPKEGDGPKAAAEQD
ncbi:hypothetical protein FYK55_01715 [Roseiconus nitratireducens]|uniref:DUF5666 domain-containing protein n=1 Tax=Roseiconus nitratireducens TaxID=2605748 RepID=A0A5M6DNY8_9BACT|nr:hypothetical protein [Roseiconus nitratireducens]KAA5547155.1 hypothetical protein FYK55_01715 [Roseiconus nitratireducens]